MRPAGQRVSGQTQTASRSHREVLPPTSVSLQLKETGTKKDSAKKSGAKKTG